MIVLTGGDLVLPDRILTGGSLLIEASRIAAIDSAGGADPAGASFIDVSGCYVVPGFVDVHVHGIDGIDTLDGGDAVAQIAARLPRYGVTAFCPTTVACSPRDLGAVLAQVRHARTAPGHGHARVLPAHLESNFVNPEYRGAQPAACLRLPSRTAGDDEREFSGADVLSVIRTAAVDVGIVTVAPELPGCLDLIRTLSTAGHRVSLGHSAATFDEAMAAIDAGALHATHLFNRMPPMAHRAPGLAGAVLARDEVTAELICDGFHVHPAMCRVAIRAKGTSGVMAITDATAGSGLPPGSEARLGGRAIHTTRDAALLADGTLAGSTLTMDGAFRNVVVRMGFSIADAAMLCSTTPARALGLTGFGVIAAGMVADLVVLDRAFRVVRTFIDGVEVYRRGATA
jgi:N-acetylglucosamine-6-phosphate deacetylase